MKPASIYARRDLKAIAARWNARAKTWDHALQAEDCHLNDDNAYARFIRVLKTQIKKRPKFCATQGVIDVGCGTGLVLGEVISEFAWGNGVDVSPKMIHQSRTKNIPNTKFLIGDCFDLPSICPKAGAVVSRGVLLSHYGLRTGQTLLRAARSVLETGGFALFDFLNEAARINQSHAPENKRWFNPEEVVAIAQRAGFCKVEILGNPKRRVLILLARP